jgi:hypothetical protein
MEVEWIVSITQEGVWLSGRMGDSVWRTHVDPFAILPKIGHEKFSVFMLGSHQWDCSLEADSKEVIIGRRNIFCITSPLSSLGLEVTFFANSSVVN